MGLLLYLLLLQLQAHPAQFMTIKVGAVFAMGAQPNGHQQQHLQLLQSSFEYALHCLNRDKSILSDIQLKYDIRYVHNVDTFHANQMVCEQINGGVLALFGPSNKQVSINIHSICDALDIPHLIMHNDDETMAKAYSINLYPTQAYVNEAIFDVVAYLNWTKVGILHEQHYGVLSVRQFMLMTNFEAFVRLVQPQLYASVLLEFKSKDINNIIIDTNTQQLPALLKEILHLQMNEYKYHYFFTSFDIDTFDLDDFKYNYVNITAFRLVSIGDVRVKEILKDMLSYYHYHYQQHQSFDNATTAFAPLGLLRQQQQHKYISTRKLKRNSNEFQLIKTEHALMYDAVHIFALGVQALKQSHKLHLLKNISCEAEEPWHAGLSLINYMNSIEWKGLTGPFAFKDGHRIQFKFDLVKLLKHNIFKVGEWTPITRLNITTPALLFDTYKMNLTLVVITILEAPYVMMHYSKNYTGNERFYGFCVDLLEKIANKLGFGYILDLVPDRKYGAKNPKTGEWNGMVEQLMKNKADLAVGSMTITYARESVIDFTKPFMNLGIGILLKVPTATPKHLFSFMNPLAVEVWLCVFAAYFLVSFTLHMLVRCATILTTTATTTTICTLDNQQSDELKSNLKTTAVTPIQPVKAKTRVIMLNKRSSSSAITTTTTVAAASTVSEQSQQMPPPTGGMTLANTFWFTIGTLMQQTTELNPQSISTRIVSGIWWLFTLIIISSYTANLAAFLTVERMITPIENAEDLASQTEIAYGTLESGSTMAFFRDSLIETYRKMWRNMDNKKTNVFTTTYDEGIERVNRGNYAFLMESTMIDYTVQRNCNLTQVGGLLDAKGYGIATPKGSPWRDRISLAILQLQENGDIQLLYDKWWKQRQRDTNTNSNSNNNNDNCIIRDAEHKHMKANALSLDNIGGIFVVLIAGIFVAILVSIIEFQQHYAQRKMLLQQQLQQIGRQYDGLNRLDQRSARLQQTPSMRSLWSEMGIAFYRALRWYER